MSVVLSASSKKGRPAGVMVAGFLAAEGGQGCSDPSRRLSGSGLDGVQAEGAPLRGKKLLGTLSVVIHVHFGVMSMPWVLGDGRRPINEGWLYTASLGPAACEEDERRNGLAKLSRVAGDVGRPAPWIGYRRALRG